MQKRQQLVGGGFLLIAILVFSLTAHAQGQHQPPFGPPLRPLIKLIGYFDATPPKDTVYPVLTMKLPDDEKRYTFLLTDMKIMAGPLRTPGDILSEVKPYSTNFYVRTSREIAKQLANASPKETLSILAEYTSADRALLVQNVEKIDKATEG